MCSVFTPHSDPEAAESDLMVNAPFVGQVQGGSHCEQQKLEGFTEMKASQVLEVMMKVFIN